MRTKHTYNEIAQSYELWGEYVDPLHLDSKEEFNAKSLESRIRFIVRCFGEENVEN